MHVSPGVWRVVMGCHIRGCRHVHHQNWLEGCGSELPLVQISHLIKLNELPTICQFRDYLSLSLLQVLLPNDLGSDVTTPAGLHMLMFPRLPVCQSEGMQSENPCLGDLPASLLIQLDTLERASSCSLIIKVNFPVFATPRMTD
ncbi:hypothetical protein VFPPC_15940 [Pochonia chlamydosporia 170]|uniref:Uncharacterized protein n=1 Tax=Pochonia chlamydosporia 170 TaxID=1380566 RepID=A0A179FVP4_METCM|nr:hypothetical protein VFPPC_15940 [Pochonia chlamydosporia 170]OAQ69270.1 hypothetical protein VFPPC_15940 [Pochonia chlamydosporia 170]